MRIVFNQKTDCKENIKESCAFYWVVRTLSDNGYKQVKNAGTIKECIFEKELNHYMVEKTEWYVDMENVVRLDVVELRKDNSLDEEYLQKEIVECVYEIDDNNIYIGNNTTNFVRECKNELPKIESTLKLYKEVLKLCKENKIKISYRNHYKSYLVENTTWYYEQIEKSNNIFNDMVDFSLQVKERGIHVGCGNDKILNHLHKLTATYQACFYRNTILSKVIDIHNRLEEYKTDIENGYANYSKLYL